MPYPVQDFAKEQYIGFVEHAVNNAGSYKHESLYNFASAQILGEANDVLSTRASAQLHVHDVGNCSEDPCGPL